MRRIIPRYSKENFPNVLKVVDEIQMIGKRHDASAGQVTLAWLLAQGQDIVPIPGTRNVKVRKKTYTSTRVDVLTTATSSIYTRTSVHWTSSLTQRRCDRSARLLRERTLL
jgi:aryl-alcohol dehydrogenase-like predicted oxidoreductase